MLRACLNGKKNKNNQVKVKTNGCLTKASKKGKSTKYEIKKLKDSMTMILNIENLDTLCGPTNPFLS